MKHTTTRFAGYDCIKLESECYCNPHFLELETMGPRTTLAPGESVSHRETWVVHPDVPIQDLTGLGDPSGLIGENLA